MNPTAYDLKSFYNSKVGRVVRRILQEHIRDVWPDVHGMRVMGTGYAVPYLRAFKVEAERVFAVMPAGRGVHDWPHEGPNCVALAEQVELPIETNSVDRVLVVHDLEFSEFTQPFLAEIWRVLKSDGRLMVVVPNRAGFWARAEWSPFGQGTPYSASQICSRLRESMFIHESTKEVLFMPPLKYSLFLKSARLIERFCTRFLPIGAGLHIIEASKQLYATAGGGSGSKVLVRGRGALMPKPVTNNFKG